MNQIRTGPQRAQRKNHKGYKERTTKGTKKEPQRVQRKNHKGHKERTTKGTKKEQLNILVCDAKKEI